MRRFLFLLLIVGLSACDMAPTPLAGTVGGGLAGMPSAVTAMPQPSRRPLATPLSEAPPPPSLSGEVPAHALDGANPDTAVAAPVTPAPAVDVTPSRSLLPQARGATAQLTLDLRVPQHLGAIGGPVILPIEAELSNRGTEAVDLVAPTPCAVARWRLRDGGGRLVADKPQAICVQMVAESKLQPGEILVTHERIELPAGALAKPGAYRLDYAFWGVEAQAQIAVE